jgi:hypothetical protein
VPAKRNPLLKVAMALALEILLGSMDELDVDANVDIDVDEATIVLKLSVTPLLWDVSVWIRDSVGVSCNTLSKYR